MKFNEVIDFRKDIYFGGAVQADWFYNKEKANKVAENYVFHSDEYINSNISKYGTVRIDTISLAEKIANKFNKSDANPLSLVISDYGTGKSHLAVTLGILFSGPDYAPDAYNKVIKNIKKISIEKGEEVQNLYNSNNFVLMLNGIKDFNLNYEILRLTQKSLKLYGIDDSFLSKLSSAQKTARTFLNNTGKANITIYEEEAKKFDWNEKGEQLIQKLSDEVISNDEAFKIIDTVFNIITGGNIEWTSGITAGDILDLLVEELCGESKRFDHIVILFDEFGRFLEYVANTNNSTKTGDVAFQQFLESAQNSNNKIQIINFIQSDIKTYLQRVDSTSNINRYIGRYDASDKYYISSNLENVFANLINRKNRVAFDNIIGSFLLGKTSEMQRIHSNILRWLPLSQKPTWNNFSTFRDCIIEGIYPLHPISTYMLTNLSDYLQSRSSLAIISSYIEQVKDVDLSIEIPIIMPEQLMCGDLFNEMLAAEESGRQRSTYCISYSKIIGKIGGRLSEQALKVLRSNLIINILNFYTTSKEDVKRAISICSNLTDKEIDDALKILENEYAVLGYDKVANKYDFMTDANGNHDYQILKSRKIANFEISPSILNDQQIKNLFNINMPQPSDFGHNNFIQTEEWVFNQSLFIIDEFTESSVTVFLDKWKSASSYTQAKGNIIWIYTNKDTEESSIERLKRYSITFKDTPIVLLLLKDEDNKLLDAIKEYKCLKEFDDKAINSYGKLYTDDLENVKTQIESNFKTLIKNREEIYNGEITSVKERLHSQLTKVFDRIYTKTVPFNFDGFNSTGRGYQYYLEILNMLLSDSINYDSIHDLQSDLRTRIETLFSIDAKNSWKCLNAENRITPPENENVKIIYQDICDKYYQDKSISLSNIYDVYSKPPYGICNEIITLIIALFIGKNGYGLKIKSAGVEYSINDWKEHVKTNKKTLNEKDKVEFVLKYKNAVLEHVDVGAIEESFIVLFNKIDSNKDIKQYNILFNELIDLTKQNQITDNLRDRYIIAQETLRSGVIQFNEWNKQIQNKKSAINDYKIKPNLDGLIILQKSILDLYDNDIYVKFNECSNLQDDIESLVNTTNALINTEFKKLISSSICNSEDDVIKLCSKGENLIPKLKSINLSNLAEELDVYIKKITSNIRTIRAKSELSNEIRSFITYSNVDSSNTIPKLKLLIEQSGSLLTKERELSLDKDAETERLLNNLKNINTRANNSLLGIKRELESIKQSLHTLVDINSVISLKNRIKELYKKEIDKSENTQLEIFEKSANEFIDDYHKLECQEESLSKFKDITEELNAKYSNQKFDIAFLKILKNKEDKIETNFKFLETKWRSAHLELKDVSPTSIIQWKETILCLPDYLSEKTLSDLENEKNRLENILKKKHVDTVLDYFNSLSPEEKLLCYNEIKKNFNE